MEIDDADQAAEENPQRKPGGHEKQAEKKKNPQENPIGDLNFLLEGVFFYGIHF